MAVVEKRNENGIGHFFFIYIYLFIFYLAATEMKALHWRPAQLRCFLHWIIKKSDNVWALCVSVCVCASWVWEIIKKKTKKHAKIGANYISHSWIYQERSIKWSGVGVEPGSGRLTKSCLGFFNKNTSEGTEKVLYFFLFPRNNSVLIEDSCASRPGRVLAETAARLAACKQPPTCQHTWKIRE